MHFFSFSLLPCIPLNVCGRLWKSSARSGTRWFYPCAGYHHQVSPKISSLGFHSRLRPHVIVSRKGFQVKELSRSYTQDGDRSGDFRKAKTFTYSMAKSSKLKSSIANRRVAMHALAVIALAGAAGYAAVPLYKMYCSSTGYLGTTQIADSSVTPEIVPDHPIRVVFTSQVSKTLNWSFTPVQSSIDVLPGEKVLAFYQASNHADEPLVGIATYHVVPEGTGIYFNKIQCFCFDEQRLNPHETVNMPVYFYIDPEILNDRIYSNIREIILSYTFFLADDQSSEWWEQEA